MVVKHGRKVLSGETIVACGLFCPGALFAGRGPSRAAH